MDVTALHDSHFSLSFFIFFSLPTKLDSQQKFVLQLGPYGDERHTSDRCPVYLQVNKVTFSHRELSHRKPSLFTLHVSAGTL